MLSVFIVGKRPTRKSAMKLSGTVGGLTVSAAAAATAATARLSDAESSATNSSQATADRSWLCV